MLIDFILTTIVFSIISWSLLRKRESSYEKAIKKVKNQNDNFHYIGEEIYKNRKTTLYHYLDPSDNISSEGFRTYTMAKKVYGIKKAIYDFNKPKRI